MATLILSTVGTALAGPIGGLLGSLVGQSIDQKLLGGGPRNGPRLGDLSVQTSSYGTAIPRIYGTMRVAGTIVWATDLKEESELQGDGKSQPETVVYTYSASFAVALSSRKAVRVKRIWADGKLIRGATGDFKVATKFRFYSGGETQGVDPLIGSIEGVGQTPAYRGIALAVFEDLQLASFGNRIPALTFEVIADEGDGITLGELLEDVGEGAVLCTDQRTVGGYAAHGADVAAAIAPIVDVFAIELHDDGVALRSPTSEPVRVPLPDEMGTDAEASGSAIMQREQLPATRLPGAVTLSFYEPSRDYQTGQVRVSSPAPGRVARTLALPCVLDSGNAKMAAEDLLLRAWALREQLILRLPLSYIDVSPGTRFRHPDIAGDWVADTVEVERFVVTITLRPAWQHAGIRNADPGRGNSQPDLVAVPTRIALFDLSDPETSQPTLVLAAASPTPGWVPVPIEIEASGILSASRTASGEAVLGQAVTALGPGQPWLFDLDNAFEVQLADTDHWLQSRDDESLAMGANLAMIGNEMIQFGNAEALAAGRFRLSRLLRGRRGSEWAMTGHPAGEDFVLLDARALKPIILPAEMLGSSVAVTARGPGDGAGEVISRQANGESMRPLTPAHVQAAIASDGSVMISWVRRSRLAWGWMDEVDAPADSSVSGFRLSAAGTGGSLVRDVTASAAVLTAVEVSSLGPGAVQIEVRQIGVVGLSRPAAITINA